MTCIHHFSITLSIFIALKISVLHVSLPPIPGNHWSFYCLCLRKDLFLFCFWRIIWQRTQSYAGVFISFCTLNISFFCWHDFWGEIGRDSYPCSSTGKIPPTPFWLLSAFFLYLWFFCSLKMICIGVGWISCVWHLFCLVLSKSLGSLVWCLTLISGKFSVINVSIFSFPFGNPSRYVITVPQSLRILFCSVFFRLCSLCFLVLWVSTDISSNLEILSLAMPRLLISCNHSPFLLQCFFFFFKSLLFLFGSFLGFPSLRLHCPFVLTCSQLYSLEHLTCFKFSDNSSIPVMSGSDACSVSSDCVFPFSMPYNFFLIWT